ncbi:MAG: hypothetical protein VXW91_09750, partial [Pseudomonadota bacterium]|nr:hypothetical protein [Pseudomonadota bacterium]
MNRKLLSIAVLGLALFAWQLTPTIITSAKAETEAHDDHGHDEQKDHGHDDGHEHEDAHDETDGDDHSEEGDSHDEHGHDSHKKEDSHDDHGHGGGDDHGEHEEGKVEITPDAAKLTGVQFKQAGPDTVAMTTPLTGRI